MEATILKAKNRGTPSKAVGEKGGLRCSEPAEENIDIPPLLTGEV